MKGGSEGIKREVWKVDMREGRARKMDFTTTSLEILVVEYQH